MYMYTHYIIYFCVFLWILAQLFWNFWTYCLLESISIISLIAIIACDERWMKDDTIGLLTRLFDPSCCIERMWFYWLPHTQSARKPNVWRSGDCTEIGYTKTWSYMFISCIVDLLRKPLAESDTVLMSVWVFTFWEMESAEQSFRLQGLYNVCIDIVDLSHRNVQAQAYYQNAPSFLDRPELRVKGRFINCFKILKPLIVWAGNHCCPHKSQGVSPAVESVTRNPCRFYPSNNESCAPAGILVFADNMTNITFNDCGFNYSHSDVRSE